MPNLMTMTPEQIKIQLTANILAEQNDSFRKGMTDQETDMQNAKRGLSGQVLITVGVQSNGENFVNKVLIAVSKFKAFCEDNDPHGEHDFASVKVDGTEIFWKIDYYNESYDAGSEDSAELQKTRRVLTIMTPQEY